MYMANFTQYLKDTRGELHHVAWPTREQTIVYTVIIAAISVFISLYLGLFDFFFTRSLAKGLEVLPQISSVSVTPTSAAVANTPAAPTYDTSIPGAATPKK